MAQVGHAVAAAAGDVRRFVGRVVEDLDSQAVVRVVQRAGRFDDGSSVKQPFGSGGVRAPSSRTNCQTSQ
jgi:hypothetical protein